MCHRVRHLRKMPNAHSARANARKWAACCGRLRLRSSAMPSSHWARARITVGHVRPACAGRQRQAQRGARTRGGRRRAGQWLRQHMQGRLRATPRQRNGAVKYWLALATEPPGRAAPPACPHQADAAVACWVGSVWAAQVAERTRRADRRCPGSSFDRAMAAPRYAARQASPTCSAAAAPHPGPVACISRALKPGADSSSAVVAWRCARRYMRGHVRSRAWACFASVAARRSASETLVGVLGKPLATDCASFRLPGDSFSSDSDSFR